MPEVGQTAHAQDAQPATISVKESQAIEALIAKMTPEEKAAQLQGIQFQELISDGHLSIEMCQKKIPNGIGELASVGYATTLTTPQIKAALAELQQFLRTKTRLGIPCIPHDEMITGLDASGATTYPQMIGMACTWDPELLRQNADATRQAARWLGDAQGLSPVLDVHNDAHWGRIEEAFGEEPYVTSMMGLAFVQGLQGANLREGLAATAKHFAGYGGNIESMAHFRDEVLMSHEVAVRFGHISAVMPGYHSIQNSPCAASQFLLRDILRKEWGFDGLVVSDYGAIKDWAKDAIEAGTDVDLPSGHAYEQLPKLMANGTVPQSFIDQSVRNVLTLKFKLGLMDPAVEKNSPTTYDLDSAANRDRAYKSAAESLVLLKNEGNVLPLAQGVHSIAVVGPNANSYYSLLGDYTHQMMTEFWYKHPFDPDSPKLITLLAGLKNRVGKDVQISYSRGCDWSDSLEKVGVAANVPGDPRASAAQRRPMEAVPPTNAAETIKVAAQSDVIIAAMGENRYLCGETKDRRDVRLPGDQEKFVQQLIATGKPVILVVFGGRPMVLTDVAAGCRAIVYAWYPGEEGGNAVADLLLGRINPSGKLTITLPYSNEQVPIYYRAGYSDKEPPLYPFGYGLSYTTYAYSQLQAPATAQTTDTGIPIQFQLTNSGSREGVEISQLYFSPEDPKPGQRRIELKGYSRVDLKPNESRTVTITVSPQQLARHSDDGTLTLEPGNYEIFVGASSTDIRLKAPLRLLGDKIILPHREHFFSETKVQ